MKTRMRTNATMPAIIPIKAGVESPLELLFEGEAVVVVVAIDEPFSAAALTVVKEIFDASTDAGAFALKMGSVFFNQLVESEPD